MSCFTGPNSTDDGLVFSIDAANHRSILRKKQSSNLLVDPNTWVAGTGGSTGYSANGSATEQLRVAITDDPWGGTSTVWRTTPAGNNDADGGWDSAYYPIDRNFTYRYSVWVRRHTVGTAGTFYFGMNPQPIRNDNSTIQGNPYFYHPGQGTLTLNQWYLVVGHCFFQGYTGGRHPDSGWYMNGQKISDLALGNVGAADVRWDTTTTTAMHRTYHFYTTNTASGLEFAYPRMDKCDGSEPTIQELLIVGESRPRNLVSSTQTAVLTPGTVYSNNAVTFNGTSQFIDTGNTYQFNQTGQFSIELWLKILNHSDRPIAAAGIIGKGHYYDNSWDIYLLNDNSIRFETSGNPTRLGIDTLSTLPIPLSTWRHYVATYNNGSKAIYLNGVLVGSSTYTGPGNFTNTNNVLIGRRPGDTARDLRGDISVAKIYDRMLTSSEVQINFNALRSRFGV